MKLNVKEKLDIYEVIFQSLKKYKEKYDYFNSHFEGSSELVFNTTIDHSYAYYFMKVLIKYKILIKKNEDKKLFINKELDSIDNIEEFLYIVKNNIPLKSYSRYKKLKKIKK